MQQQQHQYLTQQDQQNSLSQSTANFPGVQHSVYQQQNEKQIQIRPNSPPKQNKQHPHSTPANKTAVDWSSLLQKLVNGTPTIPNEKQIGTNLLFSNKKCQWPSCSTSGHLHFDSFEAFLQSHLIKEHRLDEESHGQILKQINLIESMELELAKHKQILNEMLNHLNNQLTAVKQQDFSLFNQQQQQQHQLQQKSENPLFLAAIAAVAKNPVKNDTNKENTAVKNEINESTNELINLKQQQQQERQNTGLTVAAHLLSNTNTNKMPVLNSSSLSTYSMPNQQRKQLEKSPVSLGNGKFSFIITNLYISYYLTH